MRVSGWYPCEVEWLSQVTDVEVNVSRVIALGKDIWSQKKEVIMATEIGIHLSIIRISVWGPLTVETDSVVTSCNVRNGISKGKEGDLEYSR